MNTAIKTILHEYKFLLNLTENLTKEKEKIWSDLLLANERSVALAHEIDEQTADQEKAMKAKIEVYIIFLRFCHPILCLCRQLSWNKQENLNLFKLLMKLRLRKTKMIFSVLKG